MQKPEREEEEERMGRTRPPYRTFRNLFSFEIRRLAFFEHHAIGRSEDLLAKHCEMFSRAGKEAGAAL